MRRPQGARDRRSPGHSADASWRFFFFNDTATTEIYTLSLHDALPINDTATTEIYTLSLHDALPISVVAVSLVVDMNRRLGGDVSLNAPIRDDGDSGEWQDWLVDEVSDQETRLVEDEESDNRKKALGEALSVLNERERRIFEARRLADDPITLEDLAVEFGVSRERVRQIEVRAFEKVQRAVKHRLAAMEARPSAPALQVH